MWRASVRQPSDCQRKADQLDYSGDAKICQLELKRNSFIHVHSKVRSRNIATPVGQWLAFQTLSLAIDLAKGFCRAKFWAKFTFWRGAVRSKVFGEVWADVFGEVFGLVLLGHSEHKKKLQQKLQPRKPTALHSKSGENSGKNFIARFCTGTLANDRRTSDVRSQNPIRWRRQITATSITDVRLSLASRLQTLPFERFPMDAASTCVLTNITQVEITYSQTSSRATVQGRSRKWAINNSWTKNSAGRFG